MISGIPCQLLISNIFLFCGHFPNRAAIPGKDFSTGPMMNITQSFHQSGGKSNNPDVNRRANFT